MSSVVALLMNVDIYCPFFIMTDIVVFIDLHYALLNRNLSVFIWRHKHTHTRACAHAHCAINLSLRNCPLIDGAPTRVAQ